MVEGLNCNECFMCEICTDAKERELSLLRDRDIIAPRLYEYCPLKDLVRSKISSHTHHLASIVDEYGMYFGNGDEK